MDDPERVSPPPSAGERQHLFVVRLWWEPDETGSFGEWRGSVEHVATREKRYFREPQNLCEFVSSHLGWET
jgi:hypothetical protein